MQNHGTFWPSYTKGGLRGFVMECIYVRLPCYIQRSHLARIKMIHLEAGNFPLAA